MLAAANFLNKLKKKVRVEIKHKFYIQPSKDVNKMIFSTKLLIRNMQ